MMLRPTTAAAITAAALVALATPASADSGMTRQVVDATGGSFTCAGTEITAVSGELVYGYHVTTSGNGAVRDNGQGVPRNVTLTDAAGDLFQLIGAFSFTDTYDPTTGQTLAGTVSDQLTIVRSDGTPFGRVGLVEHLRRDGTLLTPTFGTCVDNN